MRGEQLTSPLAEVDEVDERVRVEVEVRAGEDFDVGAYARLFDLAQFATTNSGTDYDVHPDGDRFVFVCLGGAGGGRPTVVVTNALARNR